MSNRPTICKPVSEQDWTNFHEALSYLFPEVSYEYDQVRAQNEPLALACR